MEELRNSLKPMIDSWEVTLADTWQKIRMIQDKDQRLAHVFEYNKFKDLLIQMKHIQNDTLSNHAVTIASIRCDLAQNAKFDNVGDDILEMIKTVETIIKSAKPDMMFIVSTVKRVINLLKQGDDVIPINTKKECIERLNSCIIYINQHIRYPTHGIILQLRKDKSEHKMLAAIYHVICGDCNRIMTVTGSTDEEIYAPPNCSSCKSCNVLHYSVASREEFFQLYESSLNHPKFAGKVKKIFKCF